MIRRSAGDLKQALRHFALHAAVVAAIGLVAALLANPALVALAGCEAAVILGPINQCDGQTTFSGSHGNTIIEVTNSDPNGDGVHGHAYGTGTNAHGVVGTTYNGIGVYGYILSTGTGTGVYGLASSGVGVVGSSNSNTGVYGIGRPYGVWGTSSSGHGVGGQSSTGVGVVGLSSTNSGVYGSTTSGHGLEGHSTNGVGAAGLSTNNHGVYGRSTNGSGVYGSSVYQHGVQGIASTGVGVVGISGSNAGVYGASSTGWAGQFSGSTYASGNIVAGGTKSSVAEAPDGSRRLLYAIESPGVWFEDFGTAELRGGRAIVPLEPTFAAMVNTEQIYHVFLTPLGETPGLYVAQKGRRGFEVREMPGGSGAVRFDYRIVAKRAGYEQQRLERFAPPTEPAIATQEPTFTTPDLRRPQVNPPSPLPSPEEEQP